MAKEDKMMKSGGPLMQAFPAVMISGEMYAIVNKKEYEILEFDGNIMIKDVRNKIRLKNE